MCQSKAVQHSFVLGMLIDPIMYKTAASYPVTRICSQVRISSQAPQTWNIVLLCIWLPFDLGTPRFSFSQLKYTIVNIKHFLCDKARLEHCIYCDAQSLSKIFSVDFFFEILSISAGEEQISRKLWRELICGHWIWYLWWEEMAAMQEQMPFNKS